MDLNQMQQLNSQPQMTPQMPSLPSVPEMPMEQAQMPQMPEGESITEEQRQALLEMISKIKAKLETTKATSFAANQKSELLRQDLLKQVFEKLQMAGIDLNDQASVSAFIMQLRETNPEIADMFEQAMETLLGVEELGDGQSAESIPVEQNNIENNMNINQNEEIPEDIRGSI